MLASKNTSVYVNLLFLPLQARYYTLKSASMLRNEAKPASRCFQHRDSCCTSDGSAASSLDRASVGRDSSSERDSLDSGDHVYHHPSQQEPLAAPNITPATVTSVAAATGDVLLAPVSLDGSNLHLRNAMPSDTNVCTGIYHLQLADMDTNNGTLTSMGTTYTSSSSEMPGICSQLSSPAASPAHNHHSMAQVWATFCKLVN